MKQFEINSFRDFKILNEAVNFVIPTIGKLQLREIKKIIEKHTKWVKAYKNDNKGHFFTKPTVFKNKFGGYDELIIGLYFEPESAKWQAIKINFSQRGSKIVVKEIEKPLTDKQAEKYLKNTDIKPEDISNNTFIKMYKSWEEKLMLIKLNKVATEKDADKKVQSDLPNIEDTSAVAKWLSTFFKKTKGVKIIPSKQENDTIIFFWKFTFKPSIAKFPVEEYHDMYINLITKEIGMWNEVPIKRINYGTMTTLKKLPKDLRTIMKWEKQQVIDKFNNSPANDWH